MNENTHKRANSKIKVLHTLATIESGGIEMYVHNLYQGIDQNRFAFDISVEFLQNPSGFLVQELSNKGVSVIVFPKATKSLWGYIRNLSAIIRQHGPYDVIEAPCHFFNGIILAVAWWHKIPVRISHSHNTEDHKALTLKRRIYRFVMSQFISWFATHKVACSKMAGQALYGRGKFCVVNNPILVERFAFSEDTRSQTRKKLNVKENEFLVGHIGRYDTQKNHKFLIEIFREIARLDKNSKFLSVGWKTNPAMEKIFDSYVAKAKEYKIESRMILLGPTQDAASLYNAMDCFVLPSLYEGLGMVAIEAQSCNLPCVLNEALPQEAFAGKAQACSLQQPPIQWAEAVLSTKTAKREGPCPRQVYSFSYQNVAKEMEKIYASCKREK